MIQAEDSPKIWVSESWVQANVGVSCEQLSELSGSGRG